MGAEDSRSAGIPYADGVGAVGEDSRFAGVDTFSELWGTRGTSLVAMFVASFDERTLGTDPAATKTGRSSGASGARFQRVESPQCLQWRTIPSLMIRTSDS